MAMTLLQLMGGTACTHNTVVNGLAIDSRRVREGDLFVAVPGAKLDGRLFIADALRKGAAAVLTVPGGASGVAIADGQPVIEHHNPRRLYAEMAARFCGPQPETQVAVTGTNGKTSVADFTRQLWQTLGLCAASYGTLGVRSGALTEDGGLTTPDPVALHETLARLKAAGVDHVAVEASSHGLDQCRLDGMQVKAAAFTNLTRDHLDYHITEQAYFQAKARLFTDILAPSSGCAVANIDDPWGQILDDIACGHKLERISYGRKKHAALSLAELTAMPMGQMLAIMFEGKLYEVELPLIGAFQASNALAAIGLVIATGQKPDEVMAAASGLMGVPGRMELIGKVSGVAVYVDYAHTPDGLRTVLASAKAHSPCKIHVIFGCGGDRDKGKRPQMGEIAKNYADYVYVTDDNPRSEDARAIRQQILAACDGATEIADRTAAIEAALNAARAGDMIIVAGKGHETGQIIGDQVNDYSDIETVKMLLGRHASMQAQSTLQPGER